MALARWSPFRAHRFTSENLALVWPGDHGTCRLGFPARDGPLANVAIDLGLRNPDSATTQTNSNVLEKPLAAHGSHRKL